MGLYGNKFLNNDLDVNLMKESYDNFYKLFGNDYVIESTDESYQEFIDILQEDSKEKKNRC